MVQVTQAQTYTILRNLGWRIRTVNEGTQVVRLFQRGWNLGTHLSIDGQVGPLTSAALLKSYANMKAGRGTASEHFSFREFDCNCGGAFAACQRIWIYRGLLTSLEALRTHVGGSIKIISGCRCPGRNRQIPMASSQSQHMKGTAADLHISTTHSRLASWHLFAGIGYAGSNNQVRHVDRRDLTGSGSTPNNPMKWRYSSW